MDRLINIKLTIDFTYELENEILGILLINDNKLEYKVHHKSTNKNDQIYFDSHNTKIKRRITIEFYLRTHIWASKF